MLKNIRKLLKDEEGATALEYGLRAAAVAGVLIVGPTSSATALATR